jgi:hypothetical protein
MPPKRRSYESVVESVWRFTRERRQSWMKAFEPHQNLASLPDQQMRNNLVWSLVRPYLDIPALETWNDWMMVQVVPPGWLFGDPLDFTYMPKARVIEWKLGKIKDLEQQEEHMSQTFGFALSDFPEVLEVYKQEMDDLRREVTPLIKERKEARITLLHNCLVTKKMIQ